MSLSEIVLADVQNGTFRGPLEGATHQGVCGVPGEGPHVQVWLRIEEGTIRDAAYGAHGCPSSRLASAMLCRIVRGRTVGQAAGLDAADLLKILGGLPEGKEQFAGMAVSALRQALDSAPDRSDGSKE